MYISDRSFKILNAYILEQYLKQNGQGTKY
uniref:Uncharacterized protein n=1 Tax=Arundo donax TaxID=35708 RepID=A0A0A9H8X0_ARUDO